MADERELIARLRILYDQQSAAQAKAGVDNVKKGVDSVGSSSKAAQASLKGMGEAMKIAGLAGTAALGAAGLMISKYQAAAGLGESTSRKWALATHDIEMSMVSVGRSIEQQVLPYLQKAAVLAGQVAQFAGDNPNAVKGGLVVAGGAATLGALARVGALPKMAQFARGAATGIGSGIGSMVTGFGMDYAIGARMAQLQGGNAVAGGIMNIGTAIPLVAGLATSVLGGLLTGQFFADKIAKSKFNDQLRSASSGQLGFTTAAQNATVAAYGVGKLFGGEQGGLAAASWMGKLTGAIQDTGDAAAKAADDLGVLPKEMQVYAQYLRQEAQAKEEYGIQVSRQTRDFTRQQAIAEQDFGIQRGRQLRDFNYGLMTQEQDYYRQRAIAARDFGIEIQRTEEDHQRQMKRSQEDYQYGLWDILRSGDALAYMRSQHDYNLSRSRSEEDYGIQMSRRNQDYARSLADQEQQYAIQRNRQLVEYARQQTDQEADFERQRKLALQQFAITRADQQADYDRQRALAQQAFNDQLRDLSGFWTNMATTQNYFTSQMIGNYRSMLSGAMQGKDLVNLPGRAFGGNMLPGMSYLVGETRPEIIKMGTVGGRAYNPSYPTTHGGAMGGGKFDITIAMDGDNWTPSLKSRVQAEIVDMIGGALN